jgi:hypothetical protein
MPYKDPEVRRKYQLEWIKNRRREWIAANGPCVDCGSWDDPEVDHLNPSTKDPRLKGRAGENRNTKPGTGQIWSWSEARREVELAKCVVRCGDCHKRKSSQEHPKGEQVAGAKLSDSQALEIIHSPEPHKVLADRYGISRHQVGKIKRGERWKHLHTSR